MICPRCKRDRNDVYKTLTAGVSCLPCWVRAGGVKVVLRQRDREMTARAFEDHENLRAITRGESRKLREEESP
jgi:hypothetical protein